jgi:hypothetical protein
MMQANTQISSQDGVAIGGYDPVAYFEAGTPTPGSDAHTHQWAGVTWRFADAGHREAFAAEPARYAPQCGGHCAFAASLGKVEQGSPTQWRVVDGKLFLNSNAVAGFLFRLLGRAGKADANWAQMRPSAG